MKKVTRFTVFSLTLIVLLSFSVSPEKKSPDKIIFLYCTMIKNTVTFQKMEIVNGTLKPRRKSSSGTVLYEITDIQNAVIEHGSMPAPDIQFHDQIVPGNQKMKGTASRCDTVTFVVRLPFNNNYKRASFYELSSGKTSLAKSKAKLIGSFEIPDSNEK
jgi:hypothetical protein